MSGGPFEHRWKPKGTRFRCSVCGAQSPEPDTEQRGCPRNTSYNKIHDMGREECASTAQEAEKAARALRQVRP